MTDAGAKKLATLKSVTAIDLSDTLITDAGLERLRRDDAFQQSFVDEIHMLGMIRVVQSTEPRWLRLQDELGWGPGERAADRELEDELMRRVRGIPIPGWASLMVVVLLLGGFQLLMLGIFGEYLWRAFDEARGRPRYLVEELRPSSATASRAGGNLSRTA